MHTYTLKNEQDADISYCNNMPIADHTKYDISTHLERTYGWDRARLWKRQRPTLLATIEQVVPPWDTTFVPLAVAAPRGRARA